MLLARCSVSLVVASLCLLPACGGGGGGGGGDSTAPQISASVPDGAGQVVIDMAGSWEARNAQVVDSNSTSAAPPLDGTVFVIEAGRLLSIGGLSVDSDNLALLLGAPLDAYVNQVDGRTIFYGLIVDRRGVGGTREEVAVAGGALNADTIAVEAYSSSQRVDDVEPVYVVSRYELVRVSPTAPVLLPARELTLAELLSNAFGQR